MLNLESLIYDLPEDVLKRKWAGDFAGEIELIDALLQKELPQCLRDRLMVERRVAQMLPKQFCIPRSRAFEMVREKIPDFSEEELDALELDRAIEYIYVRGEKYYLRSFLSTLLHVHPDLARRAGMEPEQSPEIDEAIAALRREGELVYDIRLRGTLRISDSAFHPGGRARVYLPLPQRCAQQSDTQIQPGAFFMADERAPQRTAYFDRLMGENEPFCVEYSYRNAVRYVDLLGGERPDAPVYPDAAPPCADDLAEQLPHIAFTPLVRAIANEWKGDETDPIRIAWRFYDAITSRIRYSYMRSYSLIDRQAEFCALNGKGRLWNSGAAVHRPLSLCRDPGALAVRTGRQPETCGLPRLGAVLCRALWLAVLRSELWWQRPSRRRRSAPQVLLWQPRPLPDGGEFPLPIRLQPACRFRPRRSLRQSGRRSGI